MKKSLLALAVLGAFAGAASAQTNVTIYGIADVGIQYTDPKGGDSTWSMASGIKNGSRLGFKGSEDLGGGLSAIFTLENGFEIDNGALAQGGASATTRATTRLFGRQAWVGLQGGFGAVKFGRQNTPIHNALDSIDPFGTGLAGNIENLFPAYAVRMDNTVNYSLPTNLGGFYGEFAYGLGEQAGSFSDNRQMGGTIGYKNGPINVLFSAHQAKPVAGATAAATATAPASAADDSKSYLLGGTYDFGVAKVHAAFQSNDSDDAAGVEDVDSRNYMLGVSAPVGGAGTVMASWARLDDKLADTESDQYAIGYVHNLSKRTNVYTSLARLNRDVPVAGVGDVNTFNVGIQHRF